MTLSPDTARAWVDVDLGALVTNARTLAAVSGSRLLPMVKANGYGLGAVEIATGMSRAGVRWDDRHSLAAIGRLAAEAPGFEGVFTHFHSADTDPGSAEVQWERF